MDKKLEADSLFQVKQYTRAYGLYFSLWDDEIFPDMNADTLAQRLEKTRNAIDKLKADAEKQLAELEKKQRDYEQRVFDIQIENKKRNFTIRLLD